MCNFQPIKLLTFGALICCFLQTCNRTQPVNERPAPDLSPIASSSCGTGEITVILLHGWNINRGYWKNQLDFLCTDYSVVAIDLPGFGDSEVEDSQWTMEKYGREVSNLITKLDVHKVILVGHSMSGDIMLEAAILQPEKVIALIGVDNFKEVGVEFGPEELAEIEAFMDLLKNDYSSIASAYAEGTLFHSSTDSAVINRVMNDFRSSDQKVGISTLTDLVDYAPREMELLKQLAVPLYLINSSVTPTSAEAITSLGIELVLLEIDSTGHYPMVERPTEFNKLLGVALDSILNNAK